MPMNWLNGALSSWSRTGFTLVRSGSIRIYSETGLQVSCLPTCQNRALYPHLQFHVEWSRSIDGQDHLHGRIYLER